MAFPEIPESSPVESGRFIMVYPFIPLSDTRVFLYIQTVVVWDF